LRIPIELYELNVVPGKATTFLAPLATKIRICFQKTKNKFSQKECVLTDYPARFKKITDAHMVRIGSIKKLGLDPQKKTVLILGGSQGSLSINKKIRQWIIANPQLKKIMQLIHQTGAQDTTDWEEFYHTAGIQAITADFFDDLASLYHAADLVICRSGAGSLFETVFFNKKCITIPLETKQNNHQVHNAMAMQKKYPGLIKVIRDRQHPKRLQKLHSTK